MQPKQTLFVLIIVFLLTILSAFSPHLPAAAQEEVSPEEINLPGEEATVEVTSSPVPEITPEPTITETPVAETTVETTLEVTAEPTLEPTIETTAEPTAEATEIPTNQVPAAPPAFAAARTEFEATPGIPLNFQVSVSDNLGSVNITTDTSNTAGGLSVNPLTPTESAAPYVTSIDVTYLPPADFAGVDVFSLTATNAGGASASVTFSVNVGLVEATPETTEEPVLTKELIINYQVGSPEEAIQAMLEALGAEEVLRIPQIGGILVRVPADFSTPQLALQAMSADAETMQASVISDIIAIEENGIDQLFGLIPNDADLGQQWGLRDNLPGIRAYNDNSEIDLGAWDLSNRRGSGVIVALLDSGIDLSHPEFREKLVPGWDFIDDDNQPNDNIGHGTHVAGIVGATFNNGIGVAGVAPKARIMPVKVCDFVGCPRIYQAAGIVYAVDRGAKIINMSLGGCTGRTTIVQGAVEYALSKGVIIVASAGNGGGQSGCASADNVYSYPASYDGVISVTGHNISGTSGRDAQGFNINDQILVSAPGINIYSTYPVDFGSYGNLSGTSMAAPHVSGIAALLLSTRVATTPAEVREALICSAVDFDPNTHLPAADGYDHEYGYGIVQADLAMQWRGGLGCQRPQLNDSLNNALSITRIPTTINQTVDVRSVTTQAVDPQICGVTREQTLWYSLRPAQSGYYQITTDGTDNATYNPVIGIYRGNPGALTEIICDDDSGFGNNAAMLANLDAGQTYYLAVGTLDQLSLGANNTLRLDIRRAFNQLQGIRQENTLIFDYFGQWSAVGVPQAQGKRVHQNNTPTALDFINFSFQGSSFALYKTPDSDDVDVYINGSLLTTIPGNATSEVVVIDDSVGQYRQVQLRAHNGGTFSLDAVEFNPTGLAGLRLATGLVDDASLSHFVYGAQWTVGAASPITSYRNSYSYTAQNDEALLFRARGNAVALQRFVGPDQGTMNVFVDGTLYETVSNNAPLLATAPYYITGLTNSDHTIQIVKVDGANIAIDSIRPYRQRALPGNGGMIDERDVRFAYSGVWSKVSDLAAFRRTLLSTSDNEAEAEFAFTGNAFCIGVQAGGSDATVLIDGEPAFSITGVGEWCSQNLIGAPDYPSSLLFNGLHTVEIEVNAPLTLDYFRPQTIKVITSAHRLVHDHDSRITSTTGDLWTSCAGTCARSLSGYWAQGRRSQRTETTLAEKTFYVNGSGFILYTSTAPNAGGWIIEIDGVPLSIRNGGALPTVNVGGTAYPVIDLQGTRFSPVAIGVTGLTPGLHKIRIRAVVTELGGTMVDFDGVRVIP